MNERKPVFSETVGTEGIDQELFSSTEAEAILGQLATAFFRQGALWQNPEVQAARHATRVRGGQQEAHDHPRADSGFAEAAVLLVDDADRIRSANGAAERIFRADAMSLVGRAASELLPATLRSGSTTLRRSDGSTFTGWLTVAPLIVERRHYRLVDVRDVTEEQRIEAERKRAEARYRTLVEQIPAVTFMASLEEGDNEIYIGPQIEALLGFTQKEWLDDPVIWFRQMHPDDQERWNAEFARGCAVGGPFRADCRFFARDGRAVWVHGEARVVRDDAGRPLFIQGIAFDISEIKAAEAKMQEAQESLVKNERLAAIGQLAASVGHELRNPLAAIRNAWFYLDKKVKATGLPATDPRVAQFANVIQGELDRCAKIIGDLLDFSRDRPLYRVPTPPGDLVSSALGVVVRPAETIEVVVDVSEDLPSPNVDAEQLRQVLVNLVQNAVEAVDPATGRVTVSALEDNAAVTFIVTDNGRGMPPEVRAKVFEPLYTTKLKGTGLGLSIVHNIIKRHQGTVTVTSTPSEGTTFRVTVPISEASEGPVPSRGGAADLRK